jgi:hypothetical protein
LYNYKRRIYFRSLNRVRSRSGSIRYLVGSGNVYQYSCNVINP